jgi:hypothetical protein
MAYQEQDHDDALRGWWQRLNAEMRFPFRARVILPHGSRMAIIEGLMPDAVEARCRVDNGRTLRAGLECIEPCDGNSDSNTDSDGTTIADSSTRTAIEDWCAWRVRRQA